MRPPAPPGMKGAHAGGVFAFAGAPMPLKAARLAPCPAIANEDIAGWPSRAYRLCSGGTTIYVAAASWLAPRAHIGVGYSKTPSGAQGRPAGDSAARASSRPAGSADGGALRRGNLLASIYFLPITLLFFRHSRYRTSAIPATADAPILAIARVRARAARRV